MGIKKWSKTANSNDSISSSAGTINWKEGMPPSAVNDSARVTMADVRDWYEDSQWVNLGDADGTTSPRRATNEISLSGTHTTTYHVGRRLKALDASGNLKYGTITATTFSGGTQITLSLDSGSLTGSVSQVWLGALTATNRAIPAPASARAVAADQTNVTGDATAYQVTWTGSETWDQYGNFTSPSFTFPQDGKLLVIGHMSLSGIGAGHLVAISVVTSNRTQQVLYCDAAVLDDGSGFLNLPFSAIMNGEAGDTAYISLTVSGGAKTVDVNTVADVAFALLH